MSLLDNLVIKNQLEARSFFDLKDNNERLDVICLLEQKPIEKLEEIFNQLVSDERMDNGYYKLKNLFSNVQMVDPNAVINLVVSSVEKKIATIHDTIYDDNGKQIDNITLGMYIQLWKSYKDFSQKMYLLIKNYQKFLIERNIKTGKISHDILSIIQICLFYNSIIKTKKDNDMSIISLVSQDINEVDKRNIDQLIDYIDSIRAFMIMKDFTIIDREKLFNIIKNIMNKTSIINIMCAHLHTLLKSLINKQIDFNDTEYETVAANDYEKKNIRKIYKITTILSTYAEKNKLLMCYTKFMQARIINLKYDNLELEIELVRRISGLLGKDDSQKLIDAVGDIINSKNANHLIQSADIKIKSTEYKKLTNISTKMLKPIVLTKNNWKIYNVSDMELIYPLELKCYLDIISKSYLSIFEGKYVVNWQPTLGMAQFEAQLGSKKVDITCNILQAIALLYFNENPQVSAEKLSTDTLLNRPMSEKILESLFEANLIIYLSSDCDENPIYVINHKNYTGENKLDIITTFIDVFQTEEDNPNNSDSDSDDKPKKKMPTKSSMIAVKTVAQVKPALKKSPPLKKKESSDSSALSDSDDESEEKPVKKISKKK